MPKIHTSKIHTPTSVLEIKKRIIIDYNQNTYSWAATRTMEIFTSGNLQLFWRKILAKMVSGY